jgi:hypothetical protein
MTALFADTFYWVALAYFADSAHQRALALTAERASSRIVTTDEVLTEYLTFFSTAPESLRREAAESVVDILASSVIRVIPQSRESFLAGLQLYRARPIKDTAWSIAFRCRRCERKGSPRFSQTTGILSRKVSGRWILNSVQSRRAPCRSKP